MFQQESKESSAVEITDEKPTPTSTPNLTRHFSSPANQTARAWISSSHTSQSPTTISGSFRSVTSPMNLSGNSRSQSFMSEQNSQFSSINSTSTPRPSQTATGSSPWGSRCPSPAVSQSSTPASIPFFKASENSKTHYPISPPWGSRCQSPSVSNNNKASTALSFSTSRPSITSVATSTISPPWGSRCQSPAVSQSTQSSTFSPGPTFKPSQTPPWGSRCQSPSVSLNNQSSAVSVSLSRPLQIFAATSPVCPPWSTRSQSPSPFQSSSSLFSTNLLHTKAATSPPPKQKESHCMSQTANNLDSKTNHRLLAKNIINAAKRKNSPSPGALSGHSLPISPLGNTQNDCQKPPISPFHPRPLGAQSPTFTSPPPTPTQRICSPVKLYNTRSLTDSDASVESEDSGLRSPGLHSYNTCPRGWGSNLRVKRSTVATDL